MEEAGGSPMAQVPFGEADEAATELEATSDAALPDVLESNPGPGRDDGAERPESRLQALGRAAAPLAGPLAGAASGALGGALGVAAVASGGALGALAAVALAGTLVSAARASQVQGQELQEQPSSEIEISDRARGEAPELPAAQAPAETDDGNGVLRPQPAEACDAQCHDLMLQFPALWTFHTRALGPEPISCCPPGGG